MVGSFLYVLKTIKPTMVAKNITHIINIVFMFSPMLYDFVVIAVWKIIWIIQILTPA